MSNSIHPSGIPRYLGLDIGDRRIGVAISDELGLTAQPMFTLTRSRVREDLKSLARLARKHAVAAIIAGNPIHLSGDQSSQALRVREFADALQAETGIPLHYWDERMTTTEAHRHLDAAEYATGRERRGVIDQVAAVLILQAWLDAHRV